MSGTSERTRYCSRCLTTFSTDAPRCTNLGCRAARPAAGWGELLEAGEVLDRTYRLHARLAIGGAGVTYLGGELGPDGVSEVGPRVAIKVLYQQRDQGSYLRRLSTEAQILQGLNHPQIVECRGFVHRAGHSPYLVTRYEEGGSLLDHLRRVGTLSIPVVAGIGRQICWALEVAHRQQVVHRDLKPENVLLRKEVGVDEIPEVRVADFGIAKVYGGVGDRLTRVGAFVGTPQYAAPEQFDGLTPEPATDVYAVGALLYFCLTARPVAEHMAELEPDSQREHLVRHLPPKLDASIGPPELRRWMEDTLAVAMAVDPGDRCDVGQLETRLAAIQDRRDPGFVPRPPVGGPIFSPVTIDAGVNTAQTLDTSFVRPLATEDVPEVPRGTVAHVGGGLYAAGPDATGGALVGGGLANGARPGGAPGSNTPPPLPPISDGAHASEAPSNGAPSNGGPPPLPPRDGSKAGGARTNGAGSNAARANGAGSNGAPADGTYANGSPRPPSGMGSGKPVATVTPMDGRSTGEARRAEGSIVGRLGCGILAAGGLVVAFVAVAVAAWVAMSGAPVVLTGNEADPDAKRDWTLVAGALGERGVAAEVACESPPYLAIEVVVEPDGAVRSAKLLNYPHEPTRACIERELRKSPFPRAGKDAVQVAVTLQK